MQWSLRCSGVIGTFQSATFELNKINILVINDQLGLLHTFPHVRPQVLLTLMPPSLSPSLPSSVSVGPTLRRLVLITLNKLRSCATLKWHTSSNIQFHSASFTLSVTHQTTRVESCYIRCSRSAFAVPKHTRRRKVTPRISCGRVAVETQRENTFASHLENSWKVELKRDIPP